MRRKARCHRDELTDGLFIVPSLKETKISPGSDNTGYYIHEWLCKYTEAPLPNYIHSLKLETMKYWGLLNEVAVIVAIIKAHRSFNKEMSLFVEFRKADPQT
jgi:hypothetical protein